MFFIGKPVQEGDGFRRRFYVDLLVPAGCVAAAGWSLYGGVRISVCEA
jgi:hypothetical protein